MYSIEEPTASVDPNFREMIYHLLTEINKQMTIDTIKGNTSI